ncbi:metal ABC transporter permease [Natronohydrobacter thiooxidans]|uniref:metal ABC transporter permease n=1 Tax=Natronohydrobacter thiooxidans TaxID=87172 RepID=UPI0008FF3F95|nr:metal ABC transporter permease [Natronohydrobacter thiooxidans]
MGAVLSSQIVQTVLLGAALLGLISGALGAFALLRGQSLLGDTVSHAALPGIVLGFLIAGGRDLGAILTGAALSGGLAALAVIAITRQTRLKPDAALGVVLGVSFAIGIVLLSHAQGQSGAASAGLSAFLFGQAAATLRSDLWIMGGLALAALSILALVWKEAKLVSFDPDFAQAIGLPVGGVQALLTVMVALAIVAGLQMVGVILMVALLIAPAAAARQWARSLGAMVFLSMGFAVASGVIGALISAGARGLATGPVVVLVATGFVALSMLAAPGRGLVWQELARRRRARNLRSDQVLGTIHALARAHDDPDYPAEQGMLRLEHRAATDAALSDLTARGLLRETTHAPETTPHWQLTPKGRARAEALEKGAKDA